MMDEDILKEVKRQRRNELDRGRYARDPEKHCTRRRQHHLQHREEENRKNAERRKLDRLDPEKQKREKARRQRLYKKQNGASDKAYYIKNREAILQRQRACYAKNREAILQRQKLYRIICKSLRTNGVETQIRTAIALENLNV